MKLPNKEKAYIPPAKLADYLLSKTHPVGRWKAGFFRAYGYNETNLDALEQQLRELINSEDVKDIALSPHGKKYIIEGVFETPIGSPVKLRTVWIIETGQNRPRFVTAYPL